MREYESNPGDPRYVVDFGDASQADFSLLGGKCAGLAALIAVGATVPPGFAVTTNAYDEMLAVHDLRRDIDARIRSISQHDVSAQARAAREIQERIKAQPVPAQIGEAIRAGYEALCARAGSNLALAVRSSGTAEDSPQASFAGQGDTYLWTIGPDAVIDRVRDCWASLFTARAIAYRAKHGLQDADHAMAVGVQQMVDARAAGVAMSLDPTNGDRSKIVIESVWGLGEPLVSGHATPDYFVVDKVLLEPIKRTIVAKPSELVADVERRTTIMRDVEYDRQNIASLTEGQILAVARVVKAVERAFGTPQDIEWAIDPLKTEDEGVVLLQSRPETVWSRKPAPTAPVKSYATGIEGVLSTLMAPLSARHSRNNNVTEGAHHDSAGTFPKSL
jgi:pyruvate, water dikinase